MNAGFIGTGSMGGMLIEAFIQSGALKPERIIAANRTRDKAEKLAAQFPGMRIADSNVEVVRESEILFLCVKPMEYKKVIDEIKSEIRPNHLLVSITSPVLLRHLESRLSCKIAKIIPSIANRQNSGASLLMYGKGIGEPDRVLLKSLYRRISEPLEIQEQFTRITSDISSCGPAFLAFVIGQFVEAAVQETGISREEATRLAGEMALGTGKLLTAGGFTPGSLQQRVCVPGGITAEAIKVMSRDMEGMFNRVIRATHAKYREDLEKLEEQFADQAAD